MDYWVFSLVGLAIYLGMFVVALIVLIPKAVAYFTLWKTTNKSSHLSASATAAVVAFFFLAADFVIFIKAFINGGIRCAS